MPDLRDDLDRLAGHAGEPVSFEDLSSARRRRERRRRAEGLVVGLAVVVAAAVFLATTFRSSPSSNVPGGTSTGVAYAPPEVPYLWPENWTVPTDGESLAAVQAAVPEGAPYATWRTDPQQVVERFATEVLGWSGIDVHAQESGPSFQTWGISPPCPADRPATCSGLPYEVVRVSQPGTTGADGIWTVESVQTGSLQLDLALTDPVPGLVGGDRVTLTDSAFSGVPVAIGVQVTNGCTSVWNGDLTGTALSVSMPGPVDPADTAGSCGRLGAGYVFAYAVAGTPSGDPFHEPQPVTALTAIPVVLDLQGEPSASATQAPTPSVGPSPSGGVDQAACLSAPASHIAIVGESFELSGCTQWAAGTRLAIDFEVRDAIPMGLELRNATGALQWSSPIVTGPGSYSFSVPALEPGQYVLVDPVHPASARLEINVGAY